MIGFEWVGLGVGLVSVALGMGIQRRLGRLSNDKSLQPISGFLSENGRYFLMRKMGLFTVFFLLLLVVLVGATFLGQLSWLHPLVVVSAALWASFLVFLTTRLVMSRVSGMTSLFLAYPEKGMRPLVYFGLGLCLLVGGVFLADISFWLLIVDVLTSHDVLGLGSRIVSRIEVGAQWSDYWTSHHIFRHFKYEELALLLFSYGIGAVLHALVLQIFGGIFKASSHMTATMAVSEDNHLAENDMRNPAVFSDLLGQVSFKSIGIVSETWHTLAVLCAVFAFLATATFYQGAMSQFSAYIAFPFLAVSVAFVSCWVQILLFSWLDLRRISRFSRHVLGVITGLILFQAGLIGVIGHSYYSVPLPMLRVYWVGLAVSWLVLMVFWRFGGPEGRHVRRLETLATRGWSLLFLRGLSAGYGFGILGVALVSVLVSLGFWMSGGVTHLAEAILGVAVLGLGVFLGSIVVLPYVFMSGPAMVMQAFGSMSGADVPVTKELEGWSFFTDRWLAIYRFVLYLVFGVGLFGSVAAVLISVIFWIKKQAGSALFYFGDVVFTNIRTMVSDTHLVLYIPEIGFEDLLRVMRTSPMDLTLLLGLSAGIALVFGLFGLVSLAIERSCQRQLDEVRTQLITYEGIAEGKSLPEYRYCIHLGIEAMIWPTVFIMLLVFLGPILITGLWGVRGILGMLMGSGAFGLLACFRAIRQASIWRAAVHRVLLWDVYVPGTDAYRRLWMMSTVGGIYEAQVAGVLPFMRWLLFVSVLFVGLGLRLGTGV